jgi:hypothetical protein
MMCFMKINSGKVKWISISIILILQSTIIIACKPSENTQQYDKALEVVLLEGMKICAKTSNDAICISAVGGNKRSIIWDGKERQITLIPRKERWHGKLGLVSPNQPNNLWKSKDGVTRVLVQEAIIRFDNKDRAINSINFPGKERYNVVYNDNGLLFTWHSSDSPKEKLLDLMVFQILIDGEKPETLPGSRNEDITISYEKSGSS